MGYINSLLDLGILKISFWNNTVLEYLVALGVFFLSLVLLNVFKVSILKNIKHLTSKTKTNLDDILIKTIDSIKQSFYSFISFWIAIQFITLPEIINKIIFYAIIIVLAYYIVKTTQKFIEYGFENIIEKKTGTDENFDPSILNLSKAIIKSILWVVAFIVILQNFGYNVSTLVGGLGIGGLAIAFAIQNILGDIFSSFSIYLDKPFQIGDFIIIGTDMGVVEKIGIKSTRIKTLQGEELVVSNKELTGTRVRNFKKMEKRRIVFGFGITYETPTEKVKKIPELISNIFNKIDKADLDRAHFKAFAGSSLDFEVVYFLNSSDYNEYMDIQQKINIAIQEIFRKEKIDFAYPTQTIYVNK
ncbi:mechanosensitive ion channel family protein [Patescibacteria group bacterium]|nr:mechanosensitive ion channel family protein [Patescibacteria group bacterium]